MVLQKVFPTERICLDLESRDKYEAFEELTELLVRHSPGFIDRTSILACLNEREAKMSTGISRGIAIPHCQVAGLDGTVGCIGISRTGLDYEALDDHPVYLVFMLVSPLHDPESHLRILDRLAILLECPDFLQAMLKVRDPAELHRTLEHYERMLIHPHRGCNGGN